MWVNIDEFIEIILQVIEKVGGVGKGKVIIVLNLVELLLMMCDIVYVLSELVLQEVIVVLIVEMVVVVQVYVSGYWLKQQVQFEVIFEDRLVNLFGVGCFFGLKIVVYFEVEGVVYYLLVYVGNFDIMILVVLVMVE